jgi:hypothetical protein
MNERHTFLKYALDGTLKVTEVQHSGHPETDGRLVGRSILSIISDSNLRCLLESIFQRVLNTRCGTTLLYRCDTPTLRRECQVAIEPAERRGEAGLEVENSVVRIETREAVALLDPAKPRSERNLRMCSWCKKLLCEPFGWFEVEEGIRLLRLLQSETLPSLTHGICPKCRDYLMGVIKRPAPASSNHPRLQGQAPAA